MKFSPGQLKDAVGVSAESFRHWKRVLPPFKNRNGYSPCFSIGDLLASAVISRLTKKCAIRVGQLSEVSEKLVSLCNEVAWVELENKLLFIDLEEATCNVENFLKPLKLSDVVIVCPLAPVMIELKKSLLKSQPEIQQGLFLFPLSELQTNSTQREDEG